MVQLKRSAPNVWPGPGSSPVRPQLPMKLEIEEDSEVGQHHPLIKRSKPSTPSNELSTIPGYLAIPPSQYNPLDEPSPLGLRLRKSPSLLDLIQMKISQSSASSSASLPAGNCDLQDKKTVKGSVASSSEKRKASNFTAVLLKIGNWEYASKYESDLVAKCYFAKQKLVWEILEGGLKSKIEIQWADIIDLKANCPDDGPGTLTLTLTRPPLFFKETNPQPRKHTLWQAAADFTDGQASIHRQHFLQCAPDVLNKHYEKLIQSDMRLSLLSQQPEMVLVSPYFVEEGFVSEDVHEPKFLEVNGLETATRSCSLKIDEQSSPGSISFEHISPEAPSPSSVMDLSDNGQSGNRGEVQAPWRWDQLKVPGICPSMSMSDLVNHIENRISERVASGNPPSSKEAIDCQETLENIAQILLSDSTQLATASDEKLMSRVNSLCCLLQEPAAPPHVTVQSETQNGGPLPDDKGKHFYPESVHGNKAGNGLGVSEEYYKDVPSCKQSPGLSRKDSFGELLFNLPRIASLPKIGSLSKFLFDISEDGENQTR